MNNYFGGKRKRNQTLLIVEGKHEKNKLFWLIFQCFPEISIDMENIWIYGTNIYVLYEDIAKEYGTEWIQEDIDLPFVVSKKQDLDMIRYKQDFTNIILVFDYERHDVNFSEEKILQMQSYFADAADMGKLYVNYPMIESYQHLKMLPDAGYANRKIPVSLQPGKEYKALVRKETGFRKILELPGKIDDFFDKALGIHEEQKRKGYCNDILELSDEKNFENAICEILQRNIEDDRLRTVKRQVKDWLGKSGYAHNGQNYWEYMRDVLQQIIYHNICKANHIQNGCYQVGEAEYKKCFEHLDLVQILKLQNIASRDSKTGFIWVLSTCVFFVAEYNFALIIKSS